MTFWMGVIAGVLAVISIVGLALAFILNRRPG